jgi:hypothetical protein
MQALLVPVLVLVLGVEEGTRAFYCSNELGRGTPVLAWSRLRRSAPLHLCCAGRVWRWWLLEQGISLSQLLSLSLLVEFLVLELVLVLGLGMELELELELPHQKGWMV